MRKRLFKPLVYVLVAAQLLLAVPAMAFSGAASDASSATACDQMEMAGTSGGDHCPCCPDGTDSMKDCLVSCTLAAVTVPATQIHARASVPSMRVDAALPAPLNAFSDPPLKPPPIV